MKLTPAQIYAYAVAYRSFLQICEHVGLSEEDALKPGTGKWVVDYITQYQTAVGLIKGMQMKRNVIQGVEAHENTSLPPLPKLDIIQPVIANDTQTTS